MSEGREVRVIWDWTVSLVHWLAVALVAGLWWTSEQNMMDWHQRCGITLMGLLVFRVYWGFFGTKTARFSTFVKGPKAIIAYGRHLFQRPYVPVVGHSPLGALSVVAMLVALVAQICFGLFAVDVDGMESGPLARHVSFDLGRTFADLHELNFNILLGLIGLHIAAIAAYFILLRTNLVTAMVTGRRASRNEPAEVEMTPPSLLKVIIGIVISAGSVWLIYI